MGQIERSQESEETRGLIRRRGDCFLDEKALLIQNPDHSEEEDRFLFLGLSSNLRILLVCHCYRQSDRVKRVISARKASQSEQHQYWERWKA